MIVVAFFLSVTLFTHDSGYYGLLVFLGIVCFWAVWMLSWAVWMLSWGLFVCFLRDCLFLGFVSLLFTCLIAFFGIVCFWAVCMFSWAVGMFVFGLFRCCSCCIVLVFYVGDFVLL